MFTDEKLNAASGMNALVQKNVLCFCHNCYVKVNYISFFYVNPQADDDTFARLDLMLAELTNVNLDKWLYWGYFTGRASVYHKGRLVFKFEIFY